MGFEFKVQLCFEFVNFGGSLCPVATDFIDTARFLRLGFGIRLVCISSQKPYSIWLLFNRRAIRKTFPDLRSLHAALDRLLHDCLRLGALRKVLDLGCLRHLLFDLSYGH